MRFSFDLSGFSVEGSSGVLVEFHLLELVRGNGHDADRKEIFHSVTGIHGAYDNFFLVYDWVVIFSIINLVRFSFKISSLFRENVLFASHTVKRSPFAVRRKLYVLCKQSDRQEQQLPLTVKISSNNEYSNINRLDLFHFLLPS